MQELILFILKSTTVSGILFAWYFLALKNRRIHNYNRFFLLFTLYASLQIPLLDFNWSPVMETQPVILNSARLMLHTLNGPDSITSATQNQTANSINWQAIIIGISITVSLGLLVTMLTRVFMILRLGKKYPCSFADGIRMVNTNLPKAPFSFMNTIYWRDTLSPQSSSGKIILQHELTHIKQKHTIDKLVSQLLSCIFWMNPFYWFIQKELGMVHEFIADEEAIVNSNSGLRQEDHTEVFAKMLLQVHFSTTYLTPEHQFFSSPIKRRLIMLQRNKTIKASVLRRAAILPLLAGSILLFAFSPRTAPGSTVMKADKKLVLLVDAGHGGTDAGGQYGSLLEKDLSLKVALRLKDLAPNYNIEAHLTRSEDKFLSLDERVAYSNQLHPDDFISIHVDDEPGKENGKGTFDIAINDKNAQAEESKRLAYAILKRASRPEWEQKKNFSEKNLYVLRENISSAALIEIGDIKNKEQMQHILDNAKLDELCNRILEGVVEAHKE